jgi:hypothetical protein
MVVLYHGGNGQRGPCVIALQIVGDRSTSHYAPGMVQSQVNPTFTLEKGATLNVQEVIDLGCPSQLTRGKDGIS